MKKLYLDIETTGLSKERHKVTVVGAYDGDEVYQLVKGRNLCEDNLYELLEKAGCVVTYNGKRFDVPFLQKKYNIELNGNHKDLMYLGWKVGLKGGLKKIEKEIGVGRNSGVCGGSEAVRLWKKYQREECKEALRKLLMYNKEDVVNLVSVEEAIEKRLEKENS
ncbi:MAG: ribonuclease H-like domain-containing protein [Candidatus Aenigmatarchaeota archaeon]